MVYMPVVVLFFQSIGLNLREAMTINAVFSITIACFEIPSGYFSDRLGRKNALILGTLFTTIQFIAFSYSYHFSTMLLAAVFGGIGASFISGTDSAMLYDSLYVLNRKEDYLRWEGKSYALGTFSEAFAAIIGGWLAFNWGLRYPIYIQVGISFLGVLAALTLVEPPSHQTHQRSNWEHLKHILKESFLGNKKLRILIFLSSIFGLASLLLAWFAQPYFALMKINENHIGYLWAALNAVVAIFSLVAYQINKILDEKTIIFIIMLGFSLGFLIIGHYGGVYLSWGLTAMFVIYALRGIASPIFLNLINRQISSDIRATILSIRGFSVRIMYAIAAPLLGWLSDIYSTLEAFLLLGLMTGLVTIFCIGFYVWIERVRL